MVELARLFYHWDTGSMGVEGLKITVTGGSGFTGRRLVEMLVERGASRVVSFDIAPKPPGAMEHPAIEYFQVKSVRSPWLMRGPGDCFQRSCINTWVWTLEKSASHAGLTL